MCEDFSVLLNSDNENCGETQSNGGASYNKTALIAVLVSVVGTLVIGAVVYLLIVPRIRLYRQVRSNDIEMSHASSSKKLKDDIRIDKAENMEVNTVAGRFVVHM